MTIFVVTTHTHIHATEDCTQMVRCQIIVSMRYETVTFVGGLDEQAGFCSQVYIFSHAEYEKCTSPKGQVMLVNLTSAGQFFCI